MPQHHEAQALARPVEAVEVSDGLMDKVLREAIRRAKSPRLKRWLARLLEAESAPASAERGREKG